MTKYEKSCAVFGHRQIIVTNELINTLKDTFIDLIINKGVCIFYFGGFGEFDELCWKIITELKQCTFPNIKRVYVCEKEDYVNRPHKRPKNLNTDNYDEIVFFVLDFDYWYTAVYYRNIAIIDHSDFNIFYIRDTENSGAYKAYTYAKRKKRTIIMV